MAMTSTQPTPTPTRTTMMTIQRKQTAKRHYSMRTSSADRFWRYRKKCLLGSPYCLIAKGNYWTDWRKQQHSKEQKHQSELPSDTASLKAIKIEKRQWEIKFSKLLTSILGWCEYLREHSRVEPHSKGIFFISQSGLKMVYFWVIFVISMGISQTGKILPKAIVGLVKPHKTPRMGLY